MEALKQILLVADHQKDIRLTSAAQAKHNLANKVAVVGDGVEALDDSGAIPRMEPQDS